MVRPTTSPRYLELPRELGASRRFQLLFALIVLSTFDEGPDLVLYYKYILFLLGDKDFELHFNETDILSDSQRGFVETKLKLFKDWYAGWPANPDRIRQ